MSKLLNKRAIRDLALGLASNGRERVSTTFFDAIDAAVREAVSRRVNHHDNQRGRRKTLI